MSKKMSNKSLGLLLLALAVILVLTRLIKVPREEATLKKELYSIDTSQVGKIIISKGVSDTNPIIFTRNGYEWNVSQGDIKSKEEKGSARSILSDLNSVKPERLVSRTKSKWKDYELNDSTATRVKLEDKSGKVLSDIMIGKFSYNRGSGYGSYGGYGNGFSGTSFVRLSSDRDVYAVDGFMGMMLKRDFDSWRNKTFIQANKSNITKVSFMYPGNSAYQLSFKDSVWYAGNMHSDSSATANYLSSLSTAMGSTFKNKYMPSSDPVCQLKIEGNNMPAIDVRCYQGDSANEYILNSSLNPDVYFSSTKTGLYDRIFKPLSYFIKPEKKK